MNETDRLAALRRHDILDTAPEPAFDRVVAHVRDVCGVPIALVSLVDGDRQWFKAKSGVTAEETSIDTSVCALAIRDDRLFEIEDLAQDERTAAMSLVACAPNIRFYAGAPLIGHDGAALGSLCAIDVAPRPGGLTPEQRATLTFLADQVVTLIEMRTAIAEREAALADDEALLKAQAAETRYHAIMDSAIDNGIISFDEAGRVTSWSKGAERLFGWSAQEMMGEPAHRIFTPEDCATGVVEAEFNTARAAGRAADERWHLRKDGSRFYAHGAMTPLVGGREQGFVKALRDITVEHENRAALAASREKLELATRAARMGQFDYFAQSGDLDWDDRCRELFGLSPGVPVTYEGSYLAGLHPEDREMGANGVLAALDPAGTRTFDLEYRTIGIEDGLERHIHAKGTALFEGDLPVRLIGTVQDVTAERKARLVLLETEERLRLAGRATNDAIWDWDLVRDHVTWNDAIEQAYGHPLPQVEPTGAWWIGNIHPDDRERINRTIHAVIDGGLTDWTDDYRFRRADGSYADVRDRGFVLRSDDGRPLRMIGAMLDQTERMSIERELRHQASDLNERVEASEAQIERLWNASLDLLVVMAKDGTYLRANPAWKAILGYAPEEVVGLSATALVHPEAVDEAEDALSVAQVDQLNGFVTRNVHKDGSERWISWAAVAEGDEIFAVGRDVTEARAAEAVLRQTEDALRQSQKVEALGQLTGGVAHDFNNLLTVIRGSIDLLRRPNLSEERRVRYIDAIADTAERATRLTSQLLAFARRQTLRPQVIDAAANVAALQEMLGTLVGSRVAMRYDLADGAWITADPSQFDTAIVNMAVNARDAMAGEGTISLAVRIVDALPAIRSHPPLPGRHVAVSIGDTGSGIAADQVERIFEPFFTTKGVGHGTGLGLSQVFGFAKQSFGDVAVDTALGQGTTFTLYLPLAEVADTAAAGRGGDLQPLPEGSCVLVVEDNREVGAFATQALAELGHKSHWSADADAALFELALHSDRYDLVFTDVVMPGLSGVELADEIARLYPDLPVVLTSGYSHVLAESGTGGRTLLRKPYSLDELADTLSKAVHRG